MPKPHQTTASLTIKNTTAIRVDRRREPRVHTSRPVYVQPADPTKEQFEEVRIMKNFSSEGFYFTTDKNFYFKGMQLHVIPAIRCLNLEYDGEVSRIERLPGGEYGVAVRLLRVRNLIASSRTVTQSAYHSFARVDCA